MDLEERRLTLQNKLDAGKTPEERNRLGQFATPTALAREMIVRGVALLGPDAPIKFFDPAIGTGAFYSALRNIVAPERIQRAWGYEIDPYYGEPARAFWEKDALDIRLADFTTREPGDQDRATLLICNPPYVRHHHMTPATKARLQTRTEQACGLRPNGLAALYSHFMGLSHPWMAPGAIAGWLVPTAFMEVNYGRQLKEYLLTKVTLLQIHRFDPADVQFADALVSSAILWFRNSRPPSDHAALFSCGGSLESPRHTRTLPLSGLTADQKWTFRPGTAPPSRDKQTVLGDFFDIKRGLATGGIKFFIMDQAEIAARRLPMACFTPVLPSSRYLPEDEILADADGLPLIDKRLYLLDTRLSDAELARRHPTLKQYLDTGRLGDEPVSQRYLCRSRRPWYAQEKRPPAPILCTYMGRGRKTGKPFRFFLNHSRATACNVYLMLYPKPQMQSLAEKNPQAYRLVWEFLRETDPNALSGQGRVYGGGLYKLEPKELRALPAERLIRKLPELTAVRDAQAFSRGFTPRAP